MSPAVRSAAPKKSTGKKAQKVKSSTNTKTRKATKPPKATKRKIEVKTGLPDVDQIRAAIQPGGTTVGDLMKLFKVDSRNREDMTRLLASIPNVASSLGSMNEQAVVESPSLFDSLPNVTTPGFRPSFDRLRQPSVAEITFGQPNTPRDIFGQQSTSKAISPVSPGRLLQKAEGVQAFTPQRSNFGRMSSVSGSPRTFKAPSRPSTPRTPPGLRSSGPAKIVISASSKEEADAVLARQQLVRESLFELRQTLTNLNWKIQQFEELVDKAEKDIIWDTASAGNDFAVKNHEQGTPRSGKKLRFLFDDGM